MRRPAPYGSSISFGPGPLSPALKALIGANVALFVLGWIGSGLLGFDLAWTLGLRPVAVLTPPFEVWRLATYMFMHASIAHVLFNMLALWMFGTELERIWGTRYFLKYYFVTGIGAALLTVVFTALPIGIAESLRFSIVVGASGAIYGLLLAYGLSFPNRPIYMYLVFPIPAKYFVLIMGALAFYSSLSESNGVANATHLAGLVVGYLYLKGSRFHPIAEMKYWYLRWKMNRTRRKFEVLSGGRTDDWNRRIH